MTLPALLQIDQTFHNTQDIEYPDVSTSSFLYFHNMELKTVIVFEPFCMKDSWTKEQNDLHDPNQLFGSCYIWSSWNFQNSLKDSSVTHGLYSCNNHIEQNLDSQIYSDQSSYTGYSVSHKNDHTLYKK